MTTCPMANDRSTGSNRRGGELLVGQQHLSEAQHHGQRSAQVVGTSPEDRVRLGKLGTGLGEVADGTTMQRAVVVRDRGDLFVQTLIAHTVIVDHDDHLDGSRSWIRADGTDHGAHVCDVARHGRRDSHAAARQRDGRLAVSLQEMPDVGGAQTDRRLHRGPHRTHGGPHWSVPGPGVDRGQSARRHRADRLRRSRWQTRVPHTPCRQCPRPLGPCRAARESLRSVQRVHDQRRPAGPGSSEVRQPRAPSLVHPSDSGIEPTANAGVSYPECPADVDPSVSRSRPGA